MFKNSLDFQNALVEDVARKGYIADWSTQFKFNELKRTSDDKKRAAWR